MTELSDLTLPPVLSWSPSVARTVGGADPADYDGAILAGVIDHTTSIAWTVGEDGVAILGAGVPADAVRLVAEHAPDEPTDADPDATTTEWAVEWAVDYADLVDRIEPQPNREAAERIVDTYPEWGGRVVSRQVTRTPWAVS
jgi:hypothetical protein